MGNDEQAPGFPEIEPYGDPAWEDWQPIGERWGLFLRVETVTPIDLPDLPCLVSLVIENLGAEPHCCELRAIARPGGEPVTGETLRRVPVADLVSRVVAAQPVWVRTDDPDTWQLLDSASGIDQSRDRDEINAYVRARRRQEAKGRRRITDGDLVLVAEVYRAALAKGDPPTSTVRSVLRLRTNDQAARWVSRARQEGFLGKAPRRGMKGEVRADINTSGGPGKKTTRRAK
ncbi:MAG: hypothetical protein ACR2NA_03555 [Solirubrobacterales bacterium]